MWITWYLPVRGSKYGHSSDVITTSPSRSGTSTVSTVRVPTSRPPRSSTRSLVVGRKVRTPGKGASLGTERARALPSPVTDTRMVTGSPAATRCGVTVLARDSVPTLPASNPDGAPGGSGLTRTVTGALRREAVTTSSNPPKKPPPPRRSRMCGSSMASTVSSPVRVGNRATRWMR